MASSCGFSRQLLGDGLEFGHRAVDVVHLEAGAGAFDPRRVVVRIEASEPDARHRGAAHVAGRLPLLEDGVQVGAGVGVQALAGHEFGRLQQRALVIGLELEDLLEDRRGLDELAFLAQGVGDLQELLDGLLGLAGARVEIAERVRRVPVAGLIFDDAQVFRGGGFELALPKQLLGVSECSVAIE